MEILPSMLSTTDAADTENVAEVAHAGPYEVVAKSLLIYSFIKVASQCANPYEPVAGLVRFDYRDVYHPHFGNIHVKSQFSRLKPKFERQHVSANDLENLVSKVVEWASCHIDTTGREEYLKEIALTATTFVVYAVPTPQLYSKELFVGITMLFWIWFTDDAIDDLIEKKISFKVLKQGTDQLEGIFLDKYDTAKQFINVPHYPQFDEMFNLLLDVHMSFKKTCPVYEEAMDGLLVYFRRFFGCHRWYCINEINGRYSEESFKIWRKILGFADGAAGIFAVIVGISLPVEIRRSVTFRRILDILNALIAGVNDVLGMKSEFVNGAKDNLIRFKVLMQGIPLNETVNQFCQFLDAELSDYIVLKPVILEEFDHDENLVRYLDMLDSFIDGHNQLYVECTRYRYLNGSVMLTR